MEVRMSGSVAVTRAIAVPGLLLLLIIATALSLLIGAKSLPASVVLEALSGTCQSADCTIVLDARLPRTLAGLLAGGALGLAGALMQTLTRNPLADPGLLGVNAGASFAIVLGAALFGYSSAQEQLAMAFAGALVASLIVAFTGSQGGGQLSPVRLTLAGVALAAVLEGLTSGIALLNPDVYDQLRFWQAGSPSTGWTRWPWSTGKDRPSRRAWSWTFSRTTSCPTAPGWANSGYWYA